MIPGGLAWAFALLAGAWMVAELFDVATRRQLRAGWARARARARARRQLDRDGWNRP